MEQLDELVPKLGSLNQTELLQMLKSLENLLIKTKELIVKENPSPDPVDSSLFQFHPQPSLDDKLYGSVTQHLKTLKFHRNPKNSHSPEIHLFGGRKYIYNKQSADVDPTPILPNTVMDNLLRAVNTLLGTSYNSMLVNKYRDVNCALGAHKDDEKSLLLGISLWPQKGECVSA